jgi:glycosyltransferase involved in cell wall biosynthesis
MEGNLNPQILHLERKFFIYAAASGEEIERAARTRIVESFGWEAHVRAWERLYQTGSPAT